MPGRTLHSEHYTHYLFAEADSEEKALPGRLGQRADAGLPEIDASELQEAVAPASEHLPEHSKTLNHTAAMLAGALGQLPAAVHTTQPSEQRTRLRPHCTTLPLRRCLCGRRLRRAASNGARCRAFFKFKNPLQGDSESAGGPRDQAGLILVDWL